MEDHKGKKMIIRINYSCIDNFSTEMEKKIVRWESSKEDYTVQIPYPNNPKRSSIPPSLHPDIHWLFSVV